MATTFHMATDEDRKWLDYAMRKYHPKLIEAGVRIGVILAQNPAGSAVKHGGYPAAATIKPMSLKERVAKSYDVELLLDQDIWDGKTREERVALIDHELSHIQVVPAKLASRGLFDVGTQPWWATDDIGRPKVRSRKGDWNVGDGFADVVARHGENAQEYANIRAAKRLADRAAAEGEGVEIVEDVA